MTYEEAIEWFCYNPETGILTWRKRQGMRGKPGREVGSVNIKGYRQFMFKGKQYKTHRVAWLMYFGCDAKNEIDHLNGIKNDNRICNLRDATRWENCLNLEVHRNGKLVGVKRLKGNLKRPFQAVTYKNGNKGHIGTFKTELEAHLAYLDFCSKLSERI